MPVLGFVKCLFINSDCGDSVRNLYSHWILCWHSGAYSVVRIRYAVGWTKAAHLKFIAQLPTLGLKYYDDK